MLSLTCHLCTTYTCNNRLNIHLFILLGTNGFVKVVDFGFAKPVPYMNKGKELQYRTFTLCGTPDYMGRSHITARWRNVKIFSFYF